MALRKVAPPVTPRLRIVGASVSAFVALTIAVVVIGPLPGDEWVLRSLHDALGTGWDDAMVAVGDATDTWPLAAVAGALIVGLLVAGRRADATAFAVLVFVVFVVNPLLKTLVDRPRPDVRPSPERSSTNTFPSGHASGSAALVGGLAVVVRSPGGRAWVFGAGSVALVVIGFSRLAIGVHYPSDLIAGWLWVGAWTATVAGLRERASPTVHSPDPTRGAGT